MADHLRILLVEHSANDAALILRLFREAGYDVTGAKRIEDSTAMKAAMAGCEWDAVIADNDLPDFDALTALNVLHESALDIPFIVISESIAEKAAVSVLKAGAHDYVLKQNLGRLVPAVERELAEAKSRRERRRAQRVLELQMQSVELSHDAIITTEPNGRILAWNAGAEEIYGWPRAEAIGKTAAQLLPGAAGTAACEIHETLLREGRWEGELDRVARDGRRLLIDSRQVLLRDEQNRPVSILLIDRDITLPARAQLEQKKSEARYQALFESIGGGFVIGEPLLDPSGNAVDWRYLLVNSGFESMFGVKRTEVIGRRFREVFPDTRWANWVTELGQVAATGKPARLEHYGAERGRHYEGFAYCPEPGFFAVILTDITERKRATEELERANRIVRLAHVAGKSGAWELNLGTGEMTWSEEYYRLFGVDKSFTPTFESYLSLIHPDDQSRVRQEIHEVISGSGTEFTSEFRTVLKDGIHWIERRGHVVRNENGEAVRMVGLSTDITERKHLEQALIDSNEDLKRFAYVASHDLREPLRTVTAFSELLDRANHGKLDSQSEEFLAYIVTSAARMNVLINDLLEYSRVTNDATGIEPLDLNHAVEAALSDLKVHIEESGAEIVIDRLPRVFGVESLLIKVFQNLIDNAIKYRSPERRPSIRIAAQKRATDWLISVADNGIGFEMKFAEQIFVIFKRLHGAAQYPGSGIGLAIVKRIVEMHGGQVCAISEPGRSATFYFTLPSTMTRARHLR